MGGWVGNTVSKLSFPLNLIIARGASVTVMIVQLYFDRRACVLEAFYLLGHTRIYCDTYMGPL